MSNDAAVLAAGLVAITALLALLWLLLRIRRRSEIVSDSSGLWSGRDYGCPECGSTMEQGWVLLGKGAIWSPRSAGKPGSFAAITGALDNTISMSLFPAANMAWRCGDCRLLLVDHAKLVKP